ncbi:MAG: alpha/beta hydrolase [Sphingomonas sp.]|nr:alpha/beta hydrolase [Sphingomonas sp.]
MGRRDFVVLGAAMTLLGARPGRAFARESSPDPLAGLDPELRPVARRLLEAARSAPPLTAATLAQARPGGAAYAAPLRADIPVETRVIPGMPENPEVTVHIVNARPVEKRPAILHTHGGGFILGAAKWELRYLQDIAAALDCVILSVEYRLAPETRYAGSIEDNYAGLKWLHAHAPELGGDPARIALLGESAGGGHAALLAIAARDRGEVPVALQLLLYPMLDDRTGSTRAAPSHLPPIVWDAALNRLGWRSFLGMEPGDADVPVRAVPARTRDLAGLPPAYIAVGGLDLFADEDIDYARRLTDAGVPTELLVVPGAFHAFDRLAPDTAIARRFDRAKLDALRRAFGLSGAA